MPRPDNEEEGGGGEEEGEGGEEEGGGGEEEGRGGEDEGEGGEDEGGIGSIGEEEEGVYKGGGRALLVEIKSYLDWFLCYPTERLQNKPYTSSIKHVFTIYQSNADHEELHDVCVGDGEKSTAKSVSDGNDG